MKNLVKICFMSFILLTVVACAPSREEADKKLLKACKAAVEAVSPSREKIHKIISQKFEDKKSHDGLDLRVVTIEGKVTIGDGPYRKKKYTCSFEEKFGVFGIGYSVDFWLLDRDGDMYGNVDGTIMGDFNDNLKINQAVENILY